MGVRSFCWVARVQLILGPAAALLTLQGQAPDGVAKVCRSQKMGFPCSQQKLQKLRTHLVAPPPFQRFEFVNSKRRFWL